MQNYNIVTKYQRAIVLNFCKTQSFLNATNCLHILALIINIIPTQRWPHQTATRAGGQQPATGTFRAHALHHWCACAAPVRELAWVGDADSRGCARFRSLHRLPKCCRPLCGLFSHVSTMPRSTACPSLCRPFHGLKPPPTAENFQPPKNAECTCNVPQQPNCDNRH